MKKTIRILCAILFDVSFIFLLGKLLLHFNRFLFNTKYHWIYFVIIAVGYLIFAYFNHWKTLGVKLICNRNDKNTPSLLSFFLSVFVDLFTVFSFTLVIDRILRHLFFTNTLLLFWIIASLYFFICYLIAKQSLGNFLFSIKTHIKDSSSVLPVRVVFIREIIKFGFGFWLPLLALYFLFNFTNLYVDCIIILIVNLIFLLLYYTAKDTSWWDTIAKTSKSRTTKSKLIIYPIFLLFIVFIFSILLIYNNLNNSGNHKILGFKFPFKKIEHPYNYKVEPYYNFLKEKGQNPKDYILNLFDKYDIVVLCENLHPEDTQWDFIYEVISDKRFYENVGHIFTEYGCVRDQAKVDAFMQTTFDSDSALQRATATLMNYHSGNFYYFMEKLHKLNKTLPDSLKITEYFTNVYGFKYLDDAYYDSINLGRGNPLEKKYDTIMAQVVMDWYSKEKRKCLVVTNFRHAFIVNNNNIIDNSNFANNQAQYIYNEFPKQTANVMLYGFRFDGITLKPINNGIWKTALKKTGYFPVGFDFKDSPFGQDYFDRIPHLFKPYPYTYSDIFTGFVFYKPEEEFTYSKQPYKRHGAEEEYKFALQNNLVDSIRAKQLLEYYSNEGGQFGDLSFFSLYFSSYHFFDVLIWLIWASLVLLILIIRFLSCLIFRKRDNSLKI